MAVVWVRLLQLKKLVMRFNRLEAVPTIMTSATNATLGVEALDLGYNRIGSLGAEDFAYWTRLHQLWLDHNRITMVEDGAFRDHRQLTVVSLPSVFFLLCKLSLEASVT